MKKVFILIFLFLPMISFGQWYIGGKAGTTFSNYKSKTPWKEVANMGFMFGATAYKQVKTNMGVSFDVQYIQKGYFHKVCNTITDQLNASYLEIPFTVDYGFIIPSLKNFKGHLNLGFYTAYWLSGKYKMEGFDTSSENFDFQKNGAKRFDFGPVGGARIEYILQHGSSLSLDFRYELGILDLQDKIGDNTSNTNKAMIIGISYLKPLGSSF